MSRTLVGGSSILAASMGRVGCAGIFAAAFLGGMSAPAVAQSLTPGSIAAAVAAAPATAATDASATAEPSSSEASSAEATTAAAAQAADADEAVMKFFRSTTFSGYIDTYFSYSFNKPATSSNIPLQVYNPQHNQFSLSAVEFSVAKPPTTDDRLGFRLDLNYGYLAAATNLDYGDKKLTENIQEGFLSYLAPVGSGLSIDVGKFVTPIGAELIESRANYNYSRALLFGWGDPYYHMGIRLGYSLNDKVVLGGTISNGWNNVNDNNNGKTYSASLTLKPTADLSITQSYMGGPEITDADEFRHLYDLVLGYTVSPKLSLLANYLFVNDTAADATFGGVALYAKWSPGPFFSLAPRFEIFEDQDGFSTGTAQTVKEFTLTADLTHTAGLAMRIEYRRDWSDVDFFPKGSGFRDNQNIVTLAWVYGWSSK